MIIQLDIMQLLAVLLTVVGSFISVGFAIGKIILSKIDGRFSKMEQDGKEDAKEWRRIDRDLLSLKADLPNIYQRRDDAIRNQTVIEAKLDGMANKLSDLHFIDRRHQDNHGQN